MSPQQEPSREAQQHSYRLADITIRSNGALPITFKNVSLNPLGFATTAGQRLFVRMVACDQDGGVSQEQLYDVLIA